MAKFDKKKVRGETFGQDEKLVSNPNKPKTTTKNSYDTRYQSPSHSRRKSVKVFEDTYNLVEEIKYKTKEKSNIEVYKKAVEYYAKHVLGE